VVDTVILLSNLTAFRGAGNLVSKKPEQVGPLLKIRQSVAVLEAILRRIGWRAWRSPRSVKGFLQHQRELQDPWEAKSQGGVWHGRRLSREACLPP